MPQHVQGDDLGPVRQVQLGDVKRPRAGLSATRTSEGSARAAGASARESPRPAAEDRVRGRVDRLWCEAAPRVRNPNYAHDPLWDYRHDLPPWAAAMA